MNYVPSKSCIELASNAAGRALSEDEVMEAFARLDDEIRKRRATDGVTSPDKLAAFARREAERAKIAAAFRKRHAAINALVKKRAISGMDAMIADGARYDEALAALMQGTQRAVVGGRSSAMREQMAFNRRYLASGLFARMQRERPHLEAMLTDPVLDRDLTIEMAELRPDGQPGKTGNQDAEWLAKAFSDVAEMARADTNSLGGAVGKLNGWFGPQIHDDLKLMAAGKDEWVKRVALLIDVERTFPDARSMQEVQGILSGIWDNIVIGADSAEAAVPAGAGRVNPANLAKSLGKSRVLHFKDANSAMTYRAEFGHGNTISGMIAHLDKTARINGAMKAFGPNPGAMYRNLSKHLQSQIEADPNLSVKDKRKQIARLKSEHGRMKQMLDIMSGEALRPDNVTAAQIGSTARTLIRFSKLGGVALSSVTDPIAVALAAQFRGNNALAAFTSQLGSVMSRLPPGEAREMAYLSGEIMSGMMGKITSAHVADDGPRGWLAKAEEGFFKWNGLTYLTDKQRIGASTGIAAEMGMRAETSFDDLPAAYRNVLTMHGILEPQWNAIRKSGLRSFEGKNYITADRMLELPDEDIAPLVADRLGAAKTSEDRATVLNEARRDLQLQVLGFFADETRYGMIESDNASRRFTTLATRPGTLFGESMRFLMMFKSFPAAFIQRKWGRALYGYKPEQRTAQLAHIGSLLATMTIGGYVAMTLKDAAMGYWPPRDPSDMRTWGAAIAQGGALGILGDFLFAETNRFGGGVFGTFGGPAVGIIEDAYGIWQDSRDAAISGGQDPLSGARVFNMAVQNNPVFPMNLFYTRAAFNFLILDSIREALSPGYLKRKEARRETDYGQTRPLAGKPLDPLNIARAF